MGGLLLVVVVVVAAAIRAAAVGRRKWRTSCEEPGEVQGRAHRGAQPSLARLEFPLRVKSPELLLHPRADAPNNPGMQAGTLVLRF